MTAFIKQYSPDQPQGAEGGSATGDRPLDRLQTDMHSDAADATNEHELSETPDAIEESRDQDEPAASDSTILGVGPNRAAGGLSGDGSRTDEYDAAVMGIGD